MRLIRPLALYIGLRYTRAKHRNRFISFISLASMLGIALGVTVLITVLSVMNGFDYQIKKSFFALEPQITVITSDNLAAKIKGIAGVEAVAPFASGQGMVVSGGKLSGVMAMGVDPDQESNVSDLSHQLVAGNLASLQPNTFHILIGKSLAESLGLRVGDKFNLLTPQASVTLAGVFPIYKTCIVSGIFKANAGFGFESSVIYLNNQDAEKLFVGLQGMRGFHVKVKDLYAAPKLAATIASQIPPQAVVQDWTEQAGAFFQALTMEKTMLFFILLLIIAVAVFNLVSTLVMVVNDKQADIAILRTLGVSPATIMLTFIVQGAIIGLCGVLMGLVGGLLLAHYAPAITNEIQQLFHVQFLNESVFFINYLPSKIEWPDIWHVASVAFLLSLLATIYPAWTAFRTEPAKALRYE